MKNMKILLIVVIVLIAVLTILAVSTSLFDNTLSEDLNIEYRDLIRKYAKAYDLDPFLVAAVIRTESNFRPTVMSHMNAHGLMQLLPETAEWISQRRGEEYDESRITEPEYNVDLGCYYLRYLKDEFGSWELALAAYNGGPGNVRQWLENEEYSSDGKKLDHIPFKRHGSMWKKSLITRRLIEKPIMDNSPCSRGGGDDGYEKRMVGSTTGLR